MSTNNATQPTETHIMPSSEFDLPSSQYRLGDSQSTSSKKMISNGHSSMTSKKLEKLKQQLLDIRARKQMIPSVPNPRIVDSFNQLHEIKRQQMRRRELERRIALRKKEYSEMRQQLKLYKEKYENKAEGLKERPHLIKILTSKLENEYEKARDRYKEVEFNATLINGVKKVCYYRLAEIFFNENVRSLFGVIDGMKGERDHGFGWDSYHGNTDRNHPNHQSLTNPQSLSNASGIPGSIPVLSSSNSSMTTIAGNSPQVQQSSMPTVSASLANIPLGQSPQNSTGISKEKRQATSWSKVSQMRVDQQTGIGLGYLGLLITLVGEISNARMWISFTFRGARSTIKLNDGTLACLSPRERRMNEALKVLSEQLYQIMKYNLGIQLDYAAGDNFYRLCEDLSKFLMA